MVGVVVEGWMVGVGEMGVMWWGDEVFGFFEDEGFVVFGLGCGGEVDEDDGGGGVCGGEVFLD